MKLVLTHKRKGLYATYIRTTIDNDIRERGARLDKVSLHIMRD